jgi:hypothetical protein
MRAPDYTPFYCEENIWQLCQRDDLISDDAQVLFISNIDRTCAIWSQRAAPSPKTPVVWDYHVVLLDRGYIWDLDCTLGAPLPFGTWWRASFPYMDQVEARHQPMFRVIRRAEYSARLCSDRSHMRDETSWFKPPPAWPPIGQGAHNLMRFVSMEEAFVGEVMGWQQLYAYASVSGSQSVKSEP